MVNSGTITSLINQNNQNSAQTPAQTSDQTTTTQPATTQGSAQTSTTQPTQTSTTGESRIISLSPTSFKVPTYLGDIGGTETLTVTVYAKTAGKYIFEVKGPAPYYCTNTEKTVDLQPGTNTVTLVCAATELGTQYVTYSFAADYNVPHEDDHGQIKYDERTFTVEEDPATSVYV